MAPRPPPVIAVPLDEVARQACDALLGYSYQLYHTALAWLALGPDEMLHVEVAEDFAISDDGKLTLNQVKRTAAALTIRSAAVAALLSGVWNFQIANPGRSVVAALITTSKIGKEKGLAFPGKVSGLAYWRIAARDQSDVAPLRKALRSLELHADLKAFLKDGTDAQIRERLLRPIQWLDSSRSQDEIERDLEERLVYYGAALGVPAEASKNMLGTLLTALLKCVKKPAAERYVTAADLLSLFQKSTYQLLPPGFLKGLGLPAQGATVADVDQASRDVATIPPPPRAAPRLKLVERLEKLLVAHGALWLHGSSGLGKTTLALFLAKAQGSLWTFADLRDLAPSALRSLLARLADGFKASGARGLILDDLPPEPDNATLLAIARLARAVAIQDAVLIITSSKPPSPTLGGRLGLDERIVLRTPYLTQEDVADVIVKAGGDAKTWAKIVFLFCGGGHPQLVDARIVGLQQRGWPKAELLRDITPLKSVPNELEAERQAVRTRLLQDAPPAATELLLRLSLLFGNFDRAMALVAAQTPPPLQQPGLVFDSLVGPWIERLGPDRFRLSPLLKDSGEASLAAPAVQAIRIAVMESLIVQNPFPADQLLPVFLISYPLRHRKGLRWFAGALIGASTRRKTFKRLAEAVSVFSLADRGEGELLLPDDVRLSTMLRYAQLRVAVATEDYERAAIILDRALFEVGQLPPEGQASGKALIYATAIPEAKIALPPRRWLDMLLEFVAMPNIQPLMKKELVAGDNYSGLPDKATSDEFLFIIRASAVKSIDQLSELFDALEASGQEVRDKYLGAASRIAQSIGHIVASAWLAEVKRPQFLPDAAADTLHRLSETAARWRNPDLGVELLCAEAVIRDEYQHNREGALKVLQEAQLAYPNDYRISRQRQKVYYRNGEHDKALQEFEGFQARFPNDRAVDRTYAMREAGRSAAEVGDLDKAQLFFGEAWESARLCGESMGPMVAGLSADCAVLAFQAGKTDDALALMLRALTEADAFSGEKSLRERYVKLIHIGAILWMRGQAADWPVERQALVYGMCSDPNPQDLFKSRPLPQPQFVWYQLAELEAEISRGKLALTALRARGLGLLPMETMLTSRLIEAALRELDVERFVAALKVYPRAVAVGVANLKAWGGGDMFNQPVGTIAPVGDGEWAGEFEISAKNAVLAFALVCACRARNDVLTLFKVTTEQLPGLGPLLQPIFTTLGDPTEREDDIHFIIPSLISRIRNQEAFDARDAFMATVYILQFLEGSVLSETTALSVVTFFESQWRDIVANRTFSMRDPSINGPNILAACRKGLTAMARLANLALASEAAVSRKLSPELRERFTRLANKAARGAPPSEDEGPG
jgi:hypothetical protein